MIDPLISVVIPTYNGERHIMNAVHTVANQTYKNLETIIVIDGSKDGTRELLESYRATLSLEEHNRFKIICQENRGVSAARNTGMCACSGDFIALLDGDDTWHPEKIAAQVAEISKYPKQDSIFCTTNHEIVDQKTGDKQVHDNGNSLTILGLCKNTGAQPGTWLFSKDIFSGKVGGFDERMSVAEDGDYLMRVFNRQDIRAINIDRALTTYNVGNDESLSSSPLTEKKLKSFALNFEKHHDTLKDALPTDLYDRFIEWHTHILPPKMMEESLRKIELCGHQQPKSASNLAATPRI